MPLHPHFKRNASMLLACAAKNKSPGIPSSNAFLAQRLRISSTALIRLTFGQCRLLFNAVKRPKSSLHIAKENINQIRRQTMNPAHFPKFLSVLLLGLVIPAHADGILCGGIGGHCSITHTEDCILLKADGSRQTERCTVVSSVSRSRDKLSMLSTRLTSAKIRPVLLMMS